MMRLTIVAMEDSVRKGCIHPLPFLFFVSPGRVSSRSPLSSVGYLALYPDVSDITGIDWVSWMQDEDSCGTSMIHASQSSHAELLYPCLLRRDEEIPPNSTGKSWGWWMIRKKMENSLEPIYIIQGSKASLGRVWVLGNRCLYDFRVGVLCEAGVDWNFSFEGRRIEFQSMKVTLQTGNASEN